MTELVPSERLIVNKPAEEVHESLSPLGVPVEGVGVAGGAVTVIVVDPDSSVDNIINTLQDEYGVSFSERE